VAELDCHFSSQWLFKPRQEAASNKQPRLDSRDDEITGAGAASVGDRLSASAAVVMDHDDGMTLPLDTTVVSLWANDGGV